MKSETFSTYPNLFSLRRPISLRSSRVAVIVLAAAILLLASNANAGLTQCKAHPNCSLSLAGNAVQPAPFTATFHYTIGGQPVFFASIDFDDGTVQPLLTNLHVGTLTHTYSSPGTYRPFISVYNDCGGAIVFLIVTVQ